MKKISQREARRLRERVRKLEEAESKRRSVWLREWPDGVNICTVRLNDIEFGIAETARKLGHALVVIPRKGMGGIVKEFLVYAVPMQLTESDHA